MKIHTLNLRSGRIFILLLTLLALALSGCSTAKVKADILQICGIISEEEYQSYINMLNNEQLDENGNYVVGGFDNDSEFLPPEGSIHVTFADNPYIDVQYYSDANLTEPINLKQCYLMSGDCIYASDPICSHPTSKWYAFDQFCIYAYDETGKRTEELFWGNDDTPLLICIPTDYTGSEVSVTPMGKYEDRSLDLTDYYMDSTGHRKELNGTWTVNGTEAITQKVTISPTTTLVVDYTYDASQYEFVASVPNSFYHEKGLVRFDTTPASSNIEQYSIELRELGGKFSFNPALYLSEYGTVTFSYNGISIDRITDIDDGGIIHYTATPTAGYRPTNSEGDISVDASDPSKTEASIRAAIEFYPDEDVTVNLLQPEMGGTIEYSADGKSLSGSMCTLRCGTVITMNFNHWNGWIVDANAKKEYTVTAAKNQTVSIESSDLSKLFKEADDHKPTLNIVVKDSMKSAKFAVLASENGKDNLSYETGSKNSIIPDPLGQNDREIFGGEKVGTGRDIVLVVTDDTIFSGYAMKLEIVTKDINGNENKSIQYVTDLPIEKSLRLYGEGQQATSSTVYKSVTVTVSKVEVATYNTKSADHATVTIRLADKDESHTLQNGEVLESSRNVEVTITPEKGYYITGSKLNSGVYSETMKYSKWEKDYQKILDKHPAQKLWYVTLDTSDSFGVCVYKLDGVVVSGTIGIHEGQKLTLDYTLTNNDYQISRKGLGGLVGGALHSNTESITISVSGSLDGQTIRRSDYLTIERKDG